MTASKFQQGAVGPQGLPGDPGPRGATGAIGGLVLTTPPAIAFGRELGQSQTSGLAKIDLVTTDNVNAGETVFLAVRWDPQTSPTADTITSVTDSDASGTWIIDATNNNSAVPPANGPTYIALVIGQLPYNLLSGATITVNFNHIASDITVSATAMIGVFSPGASTLASSATANSGAATTTSLTSGSVTTSASSELVVSIWGTRGGTPTTFTPSAGYTKLGPSPTSDLTSTHCAVDGVYKVATAGSYSPTATTNSSNTWSNLTARYLQGVAWSVIPKVIDEKIWVTDPTYGARGDGVTDDATAINAAIAAAVAAPHGGGGIVAFQPSRTYMIGHPLEQLGRARIEGFEAKDTVIKATAGYAYSQMLRNWTAADWNSGIGESDGRTPPSDPLHSGTHAVVIYPQVSGLTFHGNAKTNISIIAWVGTQESSYFKDLEIISGVSSESNSGVWGFDIRNGLTGSGISYGQIIDCQLYSKGYERQISVDAGERGGSDFHITRVTFSPANTYSSMMYLQRVAGIHILQCHWESTTQTGALATIANVSSWGTTITDCNASIAAQHKSPFLLHTRYGGSVGSHEKPVDIKGMHFNYTGGTADTNWNGGLITDPWNTIAGSGVVDDHGTTSHAVGTIHHYTGKHLFWTDNNEQLLEKTF